jgi:hypothetical protein
MVDINGFTGGEIKVVKNIFNGNVTNTLETKYALTGGGNLTNFEWRCNTFKDFETAVIYGGTGPAQNPASGGDANNTYNNISNSWIINSSTTSPIDYSSSFPDVVNNVDISKVNVLVLTSGETPDCSINCTSIQTKYKHSPTASVESAVNEGNLSVYPNPSSGCITVDFGEGKVGSLTIYNAQGQQVQQASIASGVRYEASKSLPTGLYFIEVLTGGDKRTTKLIISK